MQRILMTADTGGGVWTYVLELIRSLENHSTCFALATLGRPLSRIERGQVRALRGVELFESHERLVDKGDWLLELEEQVQPDLIHLNGYAYASLEWMAPKLLVVHSERNYRAEGKRALESADRIVATSHSLVLDLRRNYSLEKPIQVIPNGVSSLIYSEAEKEDFVLSAGRLWDDAKNIRLLDQIAPDLSWPVLAAGSTRSASGKYIDLKGVRLLGELGPQDLASYYARAGIYVHPAKYEPFGLSILEAAMSGCALVLGDIPSLRENWQNSAVFVNTADPEAFRDTLEYLIEDRAQRLRFQAKAYERSRFYGAKKMGKSYLQEYRRLIRPEFLSQAPYLRRA